MMQSIGSQRARHDWATQQQQQSEARAHTLQQPQFIFPVKILKLRTVKGHGELMRRLRINSQTCHTPASTFNGPLHATKHRITIFFLSI